MNIPILRLELEGMKHSLAVALQQYTQQMDSDIQQTIEAYCTPERLLTVIQQHVTTTFDAIVREEVDKYFRYGKGRATIARLVQEKLDADVSSANTSGDFT